MTELTSYLKHLKFEPKLMKSVFAKYLANTRLVILVVLLLVLIGSVSFSSLPRVLNPSINIPIVIVSTVLPGASPQDIESLVTVPVEDSLGSLQKVKTITSSSQDSVSVVTLEFESGVNADEAKADVQSAVDGINDLPENAQSSKVQKLDFENEPVWTFVLSSEDDYLSLVRLGRVLRENLKNLPTVDRVEVTGLDNEEIQVLVKPQSITTYGINPIELSQTISAVTGSFPAGGINTDSSSFVLSLDPTVTTIEELRDVRISANGTTVKLSDVADIRKTTKPNVANSYFADKNQEAVQTIRFDVYKTSGANITTAVEDAHKRTDETLSPYGDKFTMSSVLNAGDEIDHQYYDLIRDMLITVSLVFLTLFIFLGVRQAIVASLAIPFSFLVTFSVMHATGISLSFIAFFSLLLSLGLLVDDTIVMISAITAYYRTGKFTPLEAALLVWRDFRTAILTTTLTTVWAFVPLLLASGIIGEFIKAIPIVVSSTLLGSFLVAVFITLPLLIILLKPNLPFRVVTMFRIVGLLLVFGIFIALAPKGALFLPALLLFVVNLFIYFQVRYILYTRLKNKVSIATKRLPRSARNDKESKTFAAYMDQGIINFDGISRRYRAIIDRILKSKRNRRLTVLFVVLFTFTSYLLLPLGYVKNEFFPKTDTDYLYVSLELPAGTIGSETSKETLKIIEEIRTIPEVKFTTATLKLGIDPGRGYTSGQDNSSLITIILTEGKEREKTSIDIAEALRDKYAKYSKGTLSVIEVSEGPPAGSDVQIKLAGDDLSTLDGYADKIQDYLNDQAGVTNVSKSLKSGTSKIVFVPDYQNMLDAGVTQDQIGLWLRTYANGFTLKENVKLEAGSTESQDIVFRTDSAPQTLKAVNSLYIPTKSGPVALSSLGSFEMRPNPTLINRENGKRTISVSAGVTDSSAVVEQNKKLEEFANSLNLPSGYSWSTGGANQENNDSVNSILQAMLLSFLLIIITMVLQFSSFRKALIVMLVIPLSISGVFIVFSLTQTPLSFPALIGVLALFGIVVKNSILVVDKINQNLATGMEYRESIVDAAEGRLEPITLTSFATIVGLIPITVSDPLWQGLGGAIIAGLIFSGTMMLFFIPVVYYLVFQSSEGKVEGKK